MNFLNVNSHHASNNKYSAFYNLGGFYSNQGKNSSLLVELCGWSWKKRYCQRRLNKNGIAEFFSINCNPFTLEDYHNSLTPNRHIDLTFKMHIGADVVFNVCEFKLITENTYSTGETNRYFADLCRLGLYQKNHNNPNSLKTYLLVAGKTEDAYPLLPPPSNGFNQLQIQQGNNHNNTPIKDWLSFDCNNPDKTFTLSKYPQFKAFNKDYKKDKTAAATGGIKWLRGNQKFTTRLVHIEGTDIGEGEFLVAVWEIITSAEGNAK